MAMLRQPSAASSSSRLSFTASFGGSSTTASFSGPEGEAQEEHGEELETMADAMRTVLSYYDAVVGPQNPLKKWLPGCLPGWPGGWRLVCFIVR